MTPALATEIATLLVKMVRKTPIALTRAVASTARASDDAGARPWRATGCQASPAPPPSHSLPSPDCTREAGSLIVGVLQCAHGKPLLSWMTFGRKTVSN